MALVHDADGLLYAAEFRSDPARVATSIARFVAQPVDPAEADAPPALAEAFRDYFAGELEALGALPTARLGNPFEQGVWSELRRIPAGETRSYGDIAQALGGAASGPGPNARAVGTANARNPLAIVVPCHRVIGADGSLTGYAAGLERKAWLLRHEGWAPAQTLLFR